MDKNSPIKTENYLDSEGMRWFAEQLIITEEMNRCVTKEDANKIIFRTLQYLGDIIIKASFMYEVKSRENKVLLDIRSGIRQFKKLIREKHGKK
jgi:hypothetical protein